MPTDQELIKIVPSCRQIAYQATEFYAFFHFGMNTYTNREWGDGTVGDCSTKCRHERRNSYL